MPIQSRKTTGPPSRRSMAATSAFRHPLGPSPAACDTLLAMLFTFFAGGGFNLVAACVIAARSTLIWATSSASVSAATNE